MQKEKLKLLYEKYGLEESMFFKHQHYTIVTRAGIEKIQQAENIRITYEIVEGNTQEGIVTLHARGYRAEEPDYVVETFGEVNPKSNRNAYPWTMAEKRALSRMCSQSYVGSDAGADQFIISMRASTTTGVGIPMSSS